MTRAGNPPSVRIDESADEALLLVLASQEHFHGRAREPLERALEDATRTFFDGSKAEQTRAAAIAANACFQIAFFKKRARAWRLLAARWGDAAAAPALARAYPMASFYARMFAVQALDRLIADNRDDDYHRDRYIEWA